MGPRLPNRENPGSSFDGIGILDRYREQVIPNQTTVFKLPSDTRDVMEIIRVPESADPLSHQSEEKKETQPRRGKLGECSGPGLQERVIGRV